MEEEPAQEFVARYEWRWPSIKDRFGLRASLFRLETMPAFATIDRRGRIASRWTGMGSRSLWEYMLARARR